MEPKVTSNSVGVGLQLRWFILFELDHMSLSVAPHFVSKFYICMSTLTIKSATLWLVEKCSSRLSTILRETGLLCASKGSKALVCITYKNYAVND